MLFGVAMCWVGSQALGRAFSFVWGGNLPTMKFDSRSSAGTGFANGPKHGLSHIVSSLFTLGTRPRQDNVVLAPQVNHPAGRIIYLSLIKLQIPPLPHTGYHWPYYRSQTKSRQFTAIELNSTLSSHLSCTGLAGHGAKLPVRSISF